MTPLRRYLLATVSSAALISHATAAETSVPAKAPPPVAPIVTWAGPYAGITLGGAFNEARFTDRDQFFFLLGGGPDNEFWKDTHAAFAAGGLLGYNWQIDRFVFGVEGDWVWVFGKETTTIPSSIPVFASSDLKWMGTARARLGYTIAPSVLMYVTGGGAWARFSDAWGSPTTIRFTMSDEYTKSGWVIGGGVEYMFAPRWTARAEVLYADFGTHRLTVTDGQVYRTDFRHAVTQVRGALVAKW
jgi:outer membrane immunogenic protein